MRSLIILTQLLSVYAFSKNVKNYHILDLKEKAPYVFELVSNIQETTITMDCMSFIHELKLITPLKRYSYYINQNDCLYVLKNMRINSDICLATKRDKYKFYECK